MIYYKGRPCTHNSGHWMTWPTGYRTWRCGWCWRKEQREREKQAEKSPTASHQEKP